MFDIKVYQRKAKDMVKEKQQLEVQQNWIPVTPAKPVAVRPRNFYAKRRLKGKSAPSFFDRISEQEHDEDVWTGENKEKDQISNNVAHSLLGSYVLIDANICGHEDIGVAACDSKENGDFRKHLVELGTADQAENVAYSVSGSDGLIDINKTIYDNEDVRIAGCGPKETGDSGNHLLESGTADHGRQPACCVLNCTSMESYEGHDGWNAPLDTIPRAEFLSFTCAVPPVFQELSTEKSQREGAIDRRTDASFPVLGSQSNLNNPEHVIENFFPEIYNVPVSLHAKNESINRGYDVTQCNREKDWQGDFSSSLENEKPHPIDCLEPATPFLKHNKRPCSGTDMNQRPQKKSKSKKKRHRPKVVVEGRPRRTVKKLTPKKEKEKYSRKTQPAEKKEKRNYNRKVQSVEKVKMSSKEASTMENRTEIVVADSSLLNAVNQASDVNVVTIIQSSLAGGPQGAITGDQGSDEKMMLSTMPEFATSHSGGDNGAATLDLDLEVKPILLNAVNQASDVNVVTIIQSSLAGGPQGAITGDQGSDEKMILSTMPEFATSHSGGDNGAATLDLDLEVKPILKSDIGKHIGGLKLLADLNLDINIKHSRCRNYETRSKSRCTKNIGCLYFGIPEICKRTRMKRKRKSKVSIILFLYDLKGHTKKKRSKRFVRRRNMASLATCNHMPNISPNLTYHELEICKDSQRCLLRKILMGETKGMEQELVLNLLKQLPIGEEQGEVNCERNAPEDSFAVEPFNQQAFGEMKRMGKDLIETPIKKLLNRKEQREEKYERNSLWSFIDGGFPLQQTLTSVGHHIRISNPVEAQNHKKKGTENFIQMGLSPIFSGSLDKSLIEQNGPQHIVGPRGTLKVFNHRATGSMKDEGVSIMGINSIINKFMSLRNSEIGAIVPHQGSLSTRKGAIVPHQGSLSIKKPKSKPKPLVALDSETVRRWIQIKRKEDGLGEEEEEVSEEREHKWEEERRIFQGRIDSFTSKMHVILGDRRFKPWKGSVVDSVVGVFLTQNVSDYLSSSAYMALASKFPVKTSNQAAFDDCLEMQNSQESTGSTILSNGTEKGSQTAQYFVTEPVSESPEDVGDMSLVDIEDIGNPFLSQMSYRHENKPIRFQNPEEKGKINPVSSSKTLNGCKASSGSISPPDFHEFFEMCCSSSGACQETDSLELMGDYQAENLVENKASTGTSFLPQECSSLTEVGIKRNLASQDIVNDKEMIERFVGALIPAASATSMQNKELHAAPKEARKITAGKKNNAKDKKVEKRDWDSLRRKYSRPRTREQTDSVDWEAVRQTDANVIAEIIKARGQHTIIAARIKGFLERVVELHGSIDLEWLRFAPPNLVKDYLLEIRGLGLKSVECVRLLALHHVAFPVDVNVARLAVRLGWVPLQPLPGDLQFHLLEEYPIMDSIQQYLWPRLCTLDQRILYELHYQMITFGKVFCTKRSPNCSSCPMRAECRHFASAVASAKLSLPGSSNKRVERSLVPSIPVVSSLPVREYGVANQMISVSLLDSKVTSEPVLRTQNFEPLIEEPKTPEHEQKIEEFGNSEHINDNEGISDDEEEIPTITLNNEELKENVQYFIDKYWNLEDGNSSRAIVPLSVDAESLPVPELKRTNHLRTEHQVYEIPDGHDILRGLEKRDPDDAVPYLLAIWTAGETPISVEQPKKRCNSQGSELCNDQTCFSCRSICEGRDNIIRGTILVPCRTAMRGRFPLNGTYFQVNEIFADHESSHNPIIVSRSSIWRLRRRTVYFGTSPSSIFRKGCSLKEIQENFWRGYICLRGWDRETRAPQPLALRFHCSPSKMEKTSRKVNPKTAKTQKSINQKRGDKPSTLQTGFQDAA